MFSTWKTHCALCISVGPDAPPPALETRFNSPIEIRISIPAHCCPSIQPSHSGTLVNHVYTTFISEPLSRAASLTRRPCCAVRVGSAHYLTRIADYAACSHYPSSSTGCFDLTSMTRMHWFRSALTHTSPITLLEPSIVWHWYQAALNVMIILRHRGTAKQYINSLTQVSHPSPPVYHHLVIPVSPSSAPTSHPLVSFPLNNGFNTPALHKGAPSPHRH
jgi:hypothetical protein